MPRDAHDASASGVACRARFLGHYNTHSFAAEDEGGIGKLIGEGAGAGAGKGVKRECGLSAGLSCSTAQAIPVQRSIEQFTAEGLMI